MVDLRNIDLSFDGKQVFKDFNLSVSGDENLLLFGRSGTGKTSILRMVLGFLQPDSGEVFFRGEPVKDNLKKVRRSIAYVPQNLDIGGGTLGGFVDEVFSLKANKDISEDPRGDFNRIAPELDLDSNILEKEIEDVSGGERQRSAVIIAEMLQRPIMLLDEPTASLDEQMKDLLARRIAENGSTCIIVSHDAIWRNIADVRIVEIGGI